MSRSKDYQRLLNDKRWREVKAIVWERANGLCEQCMAEGYVTAGVDCHHVIPVESARNPQDMEQLCYDPTNIRLLCIPCHKRIHHDLRSQTREGHQRTEQARLERWMANQSRRPKR